MLRARVMPGACDADVAVIPTAPMNRTHEKEDTVVSEEPFVMSAGRIDFTFRGGVVLANVEVVTMFLGERWQDSEHAPLMERINQFFANILDPEAEDNLIRLVANEYNGQPLGIKKDNFLPTIGPGAFAGPAVAGSDATFVDIDDGDIRRVLQGIAANPPVRLRGKDALYVLYLPKGVAITRGGARSCRDFCGYHDVTDGGVAYAVIPYPDCHACARGRPVFDALTAISSHELINAVTDTRYRAGLYNDDHAEICDICTPETATVRGYTVAKWWSPRANDGQGGCV